MIVLRYRAQIVVAATLLLCVALAAGAGLYLRHKHQWAQDKLADIEPRYARLKGLIHAAKVLQSSSAQVGKTMTDVAYPAKLEVDRAGSEVQQRVKQIFEGAGLTVVTSRIVEPKPGKNFDVLAVSVTVNGSLAGLQTALAAVRAEPPLLKIEELSISPVRRQLLSDPELVLSSMTISALRQKS